MKSMERTNRPTHPGEMLREEFLPDYGLTATSLALALGVSLQSVNELLRERRASARRWRFGWRACSAILQSSGSTPSAPLTCGTRPRRRSQRSIASSRLWQRETVRLTRAPLLGRLLGAYFGLVLNPSRARDYPDAGFHPVAPFACQTSCSAR